MKPFFMVKESDIKPGALNKKEVEVEALRRGVKTAHLYLSPDGAWFIKF